MSNLREQIKRRAAGLVRRETITLPATGLAVQVRGMMSGEASRTGELTGPKRLAVMLSLCVEDPETSAPIWNANNAADHDEVLALPVEDSTAIIEVIHRLSSRAKGAEGNGSSTASESSPSLSPLDSDAPSTS